MSRVTHQIVITGPNTADVLSDAVQGPPGPAAPVRFAVRLESPKTVEVRWVSGAVTLNALTYAAVDVGAGTGTVTVRKNSTPVAGWADLPVDSGDPVIAPAAAAVTLADGDQLTIAWTGDGTGLSLGFSE